MSTCKCNGNNSLRSVIGGTVCECGGRLELAQVIQRIVSRLNELDERDSNLIQGLVAADMGECDRCGEWFKDADLIRTDCDRVTCDQCFDWEYFVREEDDEETMNRVLPSLMHAIKGKVSRYRDNKPYVHFLPHERDGSLSEPFLAEYRKIAV